MPECLPLLFLTQTSSIAVESCSANSGVIHVALPKLMMEDRVSRTSDNVSSVVRRRNGPKSFAIRKATGIRIVWSIPEAKLSNLSQQRVAKGKDRTDF